ncbi:MAG TPA: hypothetical protein VLE02_02085 [Nitrosarchaeum sp.]|nr:hypothetical protein [Nitrosarchaeum sp.]
MQSIPNNTWTTIVYDVIDVDTGFGNYFSYDKTTGILTVKVDGYFIINAQSCWDVSAASIKALRIIKNSDINFPTFISANTSIVASVYTQSIQNQLPLSAGETINVQCFQNTGGPINLLNKFDPSGLGIPARVTSFAVDFVSR